MSWQQQFPDQRLFGQNEQAQLNQLLSAPFAGQHDPKMMLLENEIPWAYEIKAAIAEHNQAAAANKSDEDSYIILPVCEYEIAQWAVVTLEKRNIYETLDGIYKLQCLREQYKLKQSTDVEGIVEEGMTLLSAFLEQQPWHILSVDYIAELGNYIFLFDFSAFNPTKAQSLDAWRVLSGSYFYLFQIFNSNLQATRIGVSLVAECMDMGFHNMDPQVELRWTNEFNYYPIQYKEGLWLHTPMAANILFSLCKPFVSQDIMNAHHLGCYMEGYEGKIDVLFKTPTPDIAKVQLLRRLEEYLWERQTNQANYRLPALPTR